MESTYKKYSVELPKSLYASVGFLAKLAVKGDLDSIQKIIEFSCQTFVDERTSGIDNFEEMVIAMQQEMER